MTDGGGGDGYGDMGYWGLDIRHSPFANGIIRGMDVSISNALWRLLGVVLLLVANGLFVAIEFAVVSARRSRIDELVEDDAAGARLAQRVLQDPDRVLAAAQLGITMASLALGWVGEPFIADLLEPPLRLFPLGAWIDPSIVSHTVSAFIAFTLITSLHIVLGEQAPKIFAIGHAERTTIFLSPFILIFDKIFRPFINMLDHATEGTLRLVGVQPLTGHHRAILSVDELKRIVSDSQADGVLEESEEEMLHNVFEFADRQVSEAMVPRPDIIGVEATATINVFLGIFAESRHSRYPIYKENLDNIIGFVSIKDVLNFMAAEGPGSRQKPLAPLLRPALVVPEFKRIGDLFEEMQAQSIPFAVIVDEYGGTAGIVTQGGLLEEIVGRLSDETASEDPAVSQLDEQTAVVDAQLRIDEVNEELKVNLPDNDAYETLAGLILYRLQHIPKVGEHLTLDKVQLTIKEMMGAKIEKVEVKRVDTTLPVSAEAASNGADVKGES